MSTALSFLFALLVMLCVGAIIRRDPNKWYGEMSCRNCGYRWNSRRTTPPARCPKCGTKEIQVVTEASKNSLKQPLPNTGSHVDLSAVASDPLYDQAVHVVLTTGRPSASLIQRHLRIGYNQAAGFLDAMESAGLVSPTNDRGARELLVPMKEAD